MNGTPAFHLPNFEVKGLLGRGGMASVWRAQQLSLDRPVAIKILASAFATDPEDVQRFRKEAQHAAQLKHPGIVQIYDANFSDGVYYFVMELVDGYTMGELIRRKGYVAVEDVLIVAESVAVALDYAWTQFKMVHCDIKPDNIMADADGTVKVTDLGLSRSVTLARGEKTEQDDGDEVLGTPAYMSPEQVTGAEPLDCRSDIYSLGASLYHMLAGRMLFEGMSDDEVVVCHIEKTQAPDVREFARYVSPPFAMLLEKMLAKDPQYRYRDWKQVLSDLARVREGQPIRAFLIPPYGSSMLRNVKR